MVYRLRAIDQLITDHLAAMGGVLLEGPRGCGKTATGLHHANSSVRFDSSPEMVRLVEVSVEWAAALAPE